MPLPTDALIVLIITLVLIVLFITEWVRVDVAAMLALGALMLSGVLDAEEGFAGFSNDATITIASLFVVSAALINTGVLRIIGPRLARLFRANFYLGLLAMMLSIGVVSAFVNNTPVVAIFIPLMIQVAQLAKVSPSKLLMPLSFAGLFGGVCTLVGTSTNILVSGMAAEMGLEPLGMFSMTPMGLIFMAVGIIYMLFVGYRAIPTREGEKSLKDQIGTHQYVTEILITEDSPDVGTPISKAVILKELEIETIELSRGEFTYLDPPDYLRLQAGDELKVLCDVESIKQLKKRKGVELKTEQLIRELEDGDDSSNGRNSKSGRRKLLELVITPNSNLRGKVLKETGFKSLYHATVVAIKHRGEIQQQKLSRVQLRAGDIVLVDIDADQIRELREQAQSMNSPFFIISENAIPAYNFGRMFIVLPVLFGIIAVSAFGLLSLPIAAAAGALLLVITGCISMEQSYRAIDWKVIFLLAGAIGLGTAMLKSGLAEMFAELLVNNLGSLGPIALLSGLYLLTSILTETMSNNAAAAMLTPIGISLAASFGVSPIPFVMAILFAASASFMTPVGYQTNTMIYGAGNYKFRDFLRVGTPLNLIFWVLATLLIPVFFPFNP